MSTYNCIYCNKTYKSQKTLATHCIKKHYIEYNNLTQENTSNAQEPHVSDKQKKPRKNTNEDHIINNTNNGIIYNNTIYIIRYESQDLDDIFTEDQIIRILNYKRLFIEKSTANLNPNIDHPNNQIIYVTSLKNEYAYIFDGTTFIPVFKNETLRGIIDNCIELKTVL